MARLHDGGMAHGRRGIWSYLLGGDLPGPTGGGDGGDRMLGLLVEGSLYPYRCRRSYRRLSYPGYGRGARLGRQHTDLRLADDTVLGDDGLRYGTYLGRYLRERRAGEGYVCRGRINAFNRNLFRNKRLPQEW